MFFCWKPKGRTQRLNFEGKKPRFSWEILKFWEASTQRQQFCQVFLPSRLWSKWRKRAFYWLALSSKYYYYPWSRQLELHQDKLHTLPSFYNIAELLVIEKKKWRQYSVTMPQFFLRTTEKQNEYRIQELCHNLFSLLNTKNQQLIWFSWEVRVFCISTLIGWVSAETPSLHGLEINFESKNLRQKSGFVWTSPWTSTSFGPDCICNECLCKILKQVKNFLLLSLSE